jgi:hypothetical protein
MAGAQSSRRKQLWGLFSAPRNLRNCETGPKPGPAATAAGRCFGFPSLLGAPLLHLGHSRYRLPNPRSITILTDRLNGLSGMQLALPSFH